MLSLKHILQRKIFFILHLEVQMISPFFFFLVNIEVSHTGLTFQSLIGKKNPVKNMGHDMEFLPQAFKSIKHKSLNVWGFLVLWCFFPVWCFFFFFVGPSFQEAFSLLYYRGSLLLPRKPESLSSSSVKRSWGKWGKVLFICFY